MSAKNLVINGSYAGSWICLNHNPQTGFDGIAIMTSSTEGKEVLRTDLRGYQLVATLIDTQDAFVRGMGGYMLFGGMGGVAGMATSKKIYRVRLDWADASLGSSLIEIDQEIYHRLTSMYRYN